MAIKEVIIITDNDDFELFKSNLCQSVKLLDPQEAIEEIVNSHTIEKFFKENNHPNFPARSCVEVARLPKDVGLEIEAIAVRK